MAVKMATRMPSEYSDTGKGRRHAHFEHTVRIPVEIQPTPMSSRNTPSSGRRTPMHGHLIDTTFAPTNLRPGERSENSTPRQARPQSDRLTTPIIRPNSVLLGSRGPLLREQFGLSKLGLDGLTKKGLVHMRDVIRPLSASVLERKRKRREILKSAKGRHNANKSGEHDGESSEEDMFNIVKLAKEAKQFEEDTSYFRDLEKSLTEPQRDEENDTPVFNKRLFASQGTVIMTQEARRLMQNNARANASGDVESPVNKSDVHCLRCVTDGLKLIHKGQDFVKDVLSRVVTYELYEAFQHVPKKTWEDALSCYYILNGAVEVTYDMRARESRNVFQANIIYSHGTGEYVGLVSPEGPSEDLAPPATIFTKEMTQFIRVDRTRFHKIMSTAKDVINDRKKSYIADHSFLSKVPSDVKEKIIHKLTIHDYPANKVLLSQGEMTDYLFILMKGRCQTYREVFIPEAGKDVLFYLTSRDQDDFFGEECLLDQSPSFSTVVTATPITCLTLHKSALQMVKKELLAKYIDDERHEFLSPGELQDMGYKDSVWNKYKHGQIKDSLREAGKLRYLEKQCCDGVLDRPPAEEECYKENLKRFKEKGSSFEPVRPKSAIMRETSHKVPTRPHTAFSLRRASQKVAIHLEPEAKGDDTNNKVSSDGKDSALLTVDKAKELEKKIAKQKRNSIAKVFYEAMDSKDAMMKLLEENADFGSNLQHAYKQGELQDKETFMKTGVLTTMTSADIVRKAKALADTYADRWKDRGQEDEQWDTVLHAENKQAKFLISANRMRLRDLKRRMLELQRKREKLGFTKYDPDNEQSDTKTEKKTI